MTDPVLKRIQELVPDILELKFGCEVSAHGMRGYKIVYIFPTGPNGEKTVRLNDNSQWEIKDLEILGTDPTLAVILCAIEEVKAERKFGWDKIADFALHQWNKHHDSYAWHVENRLETIKFIGSLLGV